MPPRTYTGENDEKYQKLFKMYKRAHPDKLGMDVSDEVIKLWKETLQKGKDDAVYGGSVLLYTLGTPPLPPLKI